MYAYELACSLLVVYKRNTKSSCIFIYNITSYSSEWINCIVVNPAEIYQKECTSNVMHSLMSYNVCVCVYVYAFHGISLVFLFSCPRRLLLLQLTCTCIYRIWSAPSLYSKKIWAFDNKNEHITTTTTKYGKHTQIPLSFTLFSTYTSIWRTTRTFPLKRFKSYSLTHTSTHSNKTNDKLKKNLTSLKKNTKEKRKTHTRTTRVAASGWAIGQ